MAIEDIGRLTAADEQLTHQIADTFASVRESDRGWTEKVWASLARKDGGLQIDFGLGKYINRNVMDGFGGIARNHEQWTVRASRSLGSDLDAQTVGPIRYEVVEPLQKVRFVLEPNKTQPIAFDVLFEAELQPYFEKRNRVRTHNRVSQDVVRYHQAGRLSGWLQIAGERHIIGDDWFGFRDHSWGMRGDGVGTRPADIQPAISPARTSQILWGPWFMSRADGSKYELMHMVWETEHFKYLSAHVNHADGHQDPIVKFAKTLKFDPRTRFFLGGEFDIATANGEERHVEVKALARTGFHLRTGDYGGWRGGRHGVWRGEYHEDGEHIADVLEALPQLGHFRDQPVIVKTGNDTGYGIQESIFIGVFPELGLLEDSNHPTGFG